MLTGTAGVSSEKQEAVLYSREITHGRATWVTHGHRGGAAAGGGKGEQHGAEARGSCSNRG
jgi:hypothetical protein